MGVRLPTILGKAIDDAIQTLNTVSDEDEIIDLVACVDRMGELMVDLRCVASLRFWILGKRWFFAAAKTASLGPLSTMVKGMSPFGTKRSQNTFKASY